MPKTIQKIKHTTGKLFLFAALFLFFHPVNAQTYSKTDSATIFKLLDAADEVSFSGTLDSAMQLAQHALLLSESKKMSRGKGFSLLKIADIAVQRSDSGDIEKLFTDALKIGTQLKDSFMLALGYYQWGQYYMYNEQYTEAESLFNRSLATKFEKDQSSYTAVVYNDMGYMFGAKGELEKQVDCYLKAIRLYEKVQDLSGLATTTSNLGGAYFSLGNSDKAIYYLKEAAAIRQNIDDVQGLANTYGNLASIYMSVSLDSAVKYQELATKSAERNGLKKSLMQGYTNMSLLKNRQKKTTEALDYIQKAIVLCREMGDKAGMADRIRWAAILSADLKDTVAVNRYYDEAYQIASGLQNKTLLRDIFASKAAYYKSREEYENAYENLKKYYTYRDSLIDEKTKTNIAELNTKYETEKKDNEIARLATAQRIKELEIEKQKATIAGNELLAQQKQSEIDLLSKTKALQDLKLKQQDEQLEKQFLLAKNNEQQLQLAEKEKQLQEKQLQNQKQLRNIIIGGALLLLLLAGILFNRYQLKKRLEQQQVLLDVRNKIAQDLHDEIGSTLTSIKILSEVSKNNLVKDQQKASGLIEKITEQSSQMQQGMSDIVWAIKPDNDKLENMVVRMREYVSHTLESKNIETDFTINESVLSKSIGMQQRKDFFLLFKEAVNNVAKYSQSTKVDIQLKMEGDRVKMIIKDNGIGFDTSKITSSNGLKNMQARATALNGRFSIKSAAGQGTVVEVVVPAT